MEGPLASGTLIALETGLIAGAIAILAVSYNGTGKMVTATNTQKEQMDVRRATDILQYEGRTVTGADVLSLIEEHKNDEFQITVQLLNGETVDFKDNIEEALRESKTYGNRKYISPVSSFEGELSISERTHEITKLTFIEC